jgi:hypothetical protein
LRRTLIGLNARACEKAPRPVSTLPIEVAVREPCVVVSNSGTAWRCGDSRVEEIRRYQSLATTRRQSRESLSARSGRS